MKGIVMNILAEMVETQLGLEEWNTVLDEADESGIYTSTAIYDDERLLNLVGILSQRNNIPASDLVFAFGQFMFPAFYKRYPQLIDGHANMLDFLESLDSVIHVEVVKLYPGAITPGFEPDRRSQDQLFLKYESDRNLCRLAEGLIDGAASHFGHDYTIAHEPCAHHGADHCGLMVSLA